MLSRIGDRLINPPMKVDLQLFSVSRSVHGSSSSSDGVHFPPAIYSRSLRLTLIFGWRRLTHDSGLLGQGLIRGRPPNMGSDGSLPDRGSLLHGILFSVLFLPRDLGRTLDLVVDSPRALLVHGSHVKAAQVEVSFMGPHLVQHAGQAMGDGRDRPPVSLTRRHARVVRDRTDA